MFWSDGLAPIYYFVFIIGEIDKRIKYMLLNRLVAFRSRMLAFRGAGGEPPQRSVCGVSPVPHFPQESRTFHYNQPVIKRDLVVEFLYNNSFQNIVKKL
ncbi:hypothetical protein ACTQ5K_00640 [Niallia sp. Sow4_A1]|uniref:hypothetical protein n=1 Tax=Niallia sp. Sow4_A1 TaxID=3438793 RepID=UPI003F967E0D